MDGLYWKTHLKWMIWGYTYFWKHPHSISKHGAWESAFLLGPGLFSGAMSMLDMLVSGGAANMAHRPNRIPGINMFSSWWFQPL